MTYNSKFDWTPPTLTHEEAVEAWKRDNRTYKMHGNRALSFEEWCEKGREIGATILAPGEELPLKERDLSQYPRVENGKVING